jgi:uncharacterized protein (TIRG00374 family)
VRSVSVTWLAAAVAVEVASMTSFALLQRRMLAAAGAHIPLRRMTAIALAANAMNATLPGGTAVSVGYTVRRLRAWGASAPAAAFALVASGLLGAATFMLLGLVTALGSGPSAPALLGLLGLLLAAGGVAAHRDRAISAGTRCAGWALRLTGRLQRRPRPLSAAPLERFADGLRAVRTRPADWLAGAGFAALNWLADLACLVACCHAVGVHGVGLVAVTCGYLAGMSACSFSLLPGGIGATDVVIIVALTHAGSTSAAASAAVVCYRVISLGLNVTVGWLVYASTWRSRRRERPGVSRIRRAARIPSVGGVPIEASQGGRHTLDTHRRPTRHTRRPDAPQLRWRRCHALLAARDGRTGPAGRRRQR